MKSHFTLWVKMRKNRPMLFQLQKLLQVREFHDLRIFLHNYIILSHSTVRLIVQKLQIT